MLYRRIFLAIAANETAYGLVRRYRALGAFARRFYAGETLEEAVGEIRRLKAKGLSTSFNYLGENVTSPEEADAVAETYMEILQTVARDQLDSNLSVKLTQLGLDLDLSLTERLMRRVLDAADGRFVRMDMESSPYVEPTLELYSRLRGDFPNLGVVLQAYLHRTEGDLRRLLREGAPIRWVKGAYKESPDVALQRKSAIDRQYARLLEPLLVEGQYPAVATHDQRMIERAINLAESGGRRRETYEFQMIYGVRRDLQDRLVREGYKVRVYVPYGSHWYPYYMRRLAERPANLLFVLRSLLTEPLRRAA